MGKSKTANIQNKQNIREVLGCLLQQPSLIREYKVVANDFPETYFKIIFAAINNLYRKGAVEIDASAIDMYLSDHEVQYKIFEKYGGPEEVKKMQKTSLISNFKYNYDLLKKYSLLRAYAEHGFDISDFYDVDVIESEQNESKRLFFEEHSTQEIIAYFKKKHLSVIAPFTTSEGRDSKKAGVGGHEQKEKWKQDSAWGISYASAFLTTALHGIRKRRFNVKSAGTGVGKILPVYIKVTEDIEEKSGK